MKKFLIALPMIAALAACETADRTVAATTLGGIATGVAVSGDDDRLKGAIIGGAAGAAAGTLINRQNNGTCIYERPDGSRYSGACP